MNIFICTKPLQIMICMILNRHETGNHLYISDSFQDSQAIAESPELRKDFEKVVWFKTRSDALRAASKETAQVVFVDSDIGLKPLFDFCKVKAKSRKTEIHVYEEGVGTYRTNIIKNSAKKIIYKIIGAGCHFGGSRVTEKIHIFTPDLYKKNIPKLSSKVVAIEPRLEPWILKNKNKLIEIFSPGFKVDNTKGEDSITLYLSDWNVDINLINKISETNKVFVKPHPHISKEVLRKIPNNKNIELVPSSLPAEILLMLFMEKFKKINVHHSNSSCMSYIKSNQIEEFIRNQS